MRQFDFSVVLTGEFRSWLLSGLLLSLRLMSVTWLFAVPIATVVALCRLSSVRVLRGLGAAYVEGIRNVPLLVHMLFWYFAMCGKRKEAAGQLLQRMGMPRVYGVTGDVKEPEPAASPVELDGDPIEGGIALVGTRDIHDRQGIGNR